MSNHVYPDFASFALRSVITAVVFIFLFWTFNAQGAIGDLTFGVLSTFSAVVAIGASVVWLVFKP